MTAAADLPAGAYTLYPADPATAQAAPAHFREWNGPFDGRYIVEFPPAAKPPITDGWTRHRTIGGVAVEIRRSACGGDCRCAAEFRIPPNV